MYSAPLRTKLLLMVESAIGVRNASPPVFVLFVEIVPVGSAPEVYVMKLLLFVPLIMSGAVPPGVPLKVTCVLVPVSPSQKPPTLL